MAFLDFLFSVRGLVIALIACVWWIHTRPLSPAARHALVWIVTAFTLASVYIVPYQAVRLLARGYREFAPADVPSGPTAIVVLSAGNITVVDRDKQSFSILEPVSAARVLEAARVYKMCPGATVISSGGRVYDDGDDIPQPSALTMRDALVRIGVPASQIVLESESVDTHDEAVRVAPILRQLGAAHVIVVTSDVHMRRSLGVFRAQGFDAVPAIARDPNEPGGWFEWLMPDQDGLDLSGAVVHEALGIAWYVAHGWMR